MIHSPIQLQDIALSFPHKTCLAGFTTQIHHGSRIAIIGPNGGGKSTLLKILQGSVTSTTGRIIIPDNVCMGYVPQVIEFYNELSGGQRVNKALTQALSIDPNVLLLDEPTNHLDNANRKSLTRMLKNFAGTLVVVSHDVALLRNLVDILWYIDNGKIQIFSGNYDDYIRERDIQRSAIEKEKRFMQQQKKDMHHALMQEQNRAAKSRAQGEKNIHNSKWPTVTSFTKASRASETGNKKKSELAHKKQTLNQRLSELHLPEILRPKFSLSAQAMGERTLLSITEGSVGYNHKMLIENIRLSLSTHERIAILGANGCGKSTLIKAILNDAQVMKTGNWHSPQPQEIGYLDQHYATLNPDKTVLQTIQDLMPAKHHTEIRYHLSDFLFRKNEEVMALVSTLSGGEKARLTLAQIAAKTPRLLILDEITNNLDVITREHVIQVLQHYPGAMIVISHDEDFLRSLQITSAYSIENGYGVFSMW